MKRVYFLRPKGKMGPIKIGCSDSPKSRARQISSDRKERVILIADAPGGFTEETQLHRQFADARMDGEWFAPSDALMAVIDHVIDTGRLPPPPESDRAEVMARLYQDGATLKQIGAQFGMSRERARQILRKHNCPSLGYRSEHIRKPDPISDDEREFARLYVLGTAPKELRRMFPKLTPSVVLRRTETPSRPKGFWLTRPDHAERMGKIVELYRQGVTVAAIANQVGLAAPEHVYYYLRKAGISASRRSCERFSESHIAEAVRAFHGGATICGIAENLGSTPATVRKALTRAGVTVTSEELERRRIAAVRAANLRRAYHAAPSQARAA